MRAITNAINSVPTCNAPAATSPVPPLPDLATVLRQLKARREALVDIQLPAFTRDASNLIATWRCDETDGERIHAADITVHPAGAERVMHCLAEYEALRLDVASLDDLIAALELWEEGGSATLAAIDGSLTPGGDFAPLVRVATEPADARMYARWQLEYLLSVKSELRAARAAGDSGRSEALALEFAELLARVQERSARRRAA